MTDIVTGLTPRSNALYASIVATVAAEIGTRLTIRQIAERLETSPDIAARCIALHRYFRAHSDDRLMSGTLELPPPVDLTIPDIETLVDEAALGIVFHEAA